MSMRVRLHQKHDGVGLVGRTVPAVRWQVGEGRGMSAQQGGEMMNPLVWTAEAKCQDHPDPDFFFPREDSVKAARAAIERARAFCLGSKDRERCPVLEACQKHGLANEEYGVWGGLSEMERRELRGSRKSA